MKILRFPPLLLLLVLSIVSNVLGSQQNTLFQTVLPADLIDRTDLWVAKLDPCSTEPEGAIFMVQRRYLTNYARGRLNGYPWSWAPLREVLLHLDKPPTPQTDSSLNEVEKYRAGVRKAIEALQSL